MTEFRSQRLTKILFLAMTEYVLVVIKSTRNHHLLETIEEFSVSIVKRLFNGTWKYYFCYPIK